MHPTQLLDALTFAGLLIALGGVIGVSGLVQHTERRAIGLLVAMFGLIVAAVALGTWHDTEWGQYVAFCVLALAGGTYAAMGRARRTSSATEPEAAPPSEVDP